MWCPIYPTTCIVAANLLKEVCRDVRLRLEPQLQSLNDEVFDQNTANLSDKAKYDVNTRGFWTAGQVDFFDMRLFNPKDTRTPTKTR